MRRALLVALALAACTSTPEPQIEGRFYHYVRSNQDGSEPEQIYQYRASATRLEVGKEKSRCTNAAYVTAEFDPMRGHAVAFTGGRLARDLSQEAFAEMTYEAGVLHASIPAMNLDERVQVEGQPFILYDFDLADLNARFAGAAPSRTDFRFAVALIWPEDGAEDLFRNLGWANARFVAEAHHLGHNAVRFDVSGALNGQLWLDGREGHVIEARFAEPNHTEYSDFRLVLQRIDDNGAEAWRAARAAHWEGCP